MILVGARYPSITHSKLTALLFFQFAHFFNQHVVVALDDELEVGGRFLTKSM